MKVYLHGLRPVEVLILVYLIPTALLMLVRRQRLMSWRRDFGLRLLILAFVYSGRWLPLPAVVRDWYPLLGYLFFYAEIGQVNRLITQRFYDADIIRLEERIFQGQPSMYLIERLPYRWLAVFLYFSYLVYYLLTPAVGIIFYTSGQIAAFHETVFILMFAFQICFWIYIFYPVASPFYEFPHIGKPYSDLRLYRFIHRMLAQGSSKGSAFPSSHVGIGLSVLMCLGTFDVTLSVAFIPIVVGLVVATVYGRFHYAIDAYAGIAVAVVSYPVARWLYTVLQGVV